MKAFPGMPYSCFRVRTIFLLLSLFLLTSCGPSLQYSTLFDALDAGDCQGADEIVSGAESKYGRNQRLLFHMDKGMTFFRCGDTENSNEAFQKAALTAQKLWTKSLTREVTALFTNDYILPYGGEDYERAMVHLFSSLNYIRSGEPDEALVEARQLDLLLTELNDQYKKKNFYKEDAFIRYISALLYAADEDYDSAFIDFYTSWETYEGTYGEYGILLPPGLLCDMANAAVLADRLQDAGKISGKTPGELRKISDRVGQHARIYLVHTTGVVPKKEEERFMIGTKAGPVSLAFPRYGEIPPSCDATKLIVEGPVHRETPTVAVENIAAIAVKNLSDRKTRVIAKTILRAAAKQAAIEAVSHSQDNEAATRQILNFINLFVEQADTRSWRTLPARIRLARIETPPGTYQITVKDCKREHIIEENLTVSAGDIRFVFHDTMY